MSLPVVSPAPSGRWKAVALRTLEVTLALWLAVAASTKLYGADAVVQTFDTIGVGQWFRIVTGLVELSAAALLLMRGTIAFGAILAAAVMIGAASTNLLVLDQKALHAFIPALIFLTLAWVKRGELFARFAEA